MNAFSKLEVAALVSHNTEALHFAIQYLAKNGNLRNAPTDEREGSGHWLAFQNAAKEIRKTGALSQDLTHYFLRTTPYDGCVFITLYHRQIADVLTSKYEHMRARIASFAVPAQMLESRADRHQRWGEARSECSTAKTMQMFRATMSKETLKSATSTVNNFDVHVKKTRTTRKNRDGLPVVVSSK
jgi:hypothetical protein